MKSIKNEDADNIGVVTTISANSWEPSSKKMKKVSEEEDEEDQRLHNIQALKSMKYLMSISEKYTGIIKQIYPENIKKPRSALREKNTTVSDITSIINDIKKEKKLKINGNKHDKLENITNNLKYLTGGKLRSYQLDGVKWLSVLHEHSVNGILADEMGLGKTIQVIAFICYLLQIGYDGPYLIIAPLSTLPNWKNEFEKFAPELPVLLFHGSLEKRRKLKKDALKLIKFGPGDRRKKTRYIHPIILIPYHYIHLEYEFLLKFKWHLIVMDEGHVIRNRKTSISEKMRALHTSYRLLLTGTPLQNNIMELWCLLNFIMPKLFKAPHVFERLFSLDRVDDKEKLLKEEKETKFLTLIHTILEPFMLRRLKNEVLIELPPKKELYVDCPLTEKQKNLYKYILNFHMNKRNLDKFRIDHNHSDDNMRIYQPFFALRHIVNHPYLVQAPIYYDSKNVKQLLVDDNLITCSGKILVLDVMLKRLYEKKHKILLFSHFTMMLDLLEEFVLMRDYQYVRLDGRCDLITRDQSVREFNENPDIFLFLISARAGGLGLNLTSADTVIFYDKDFNPQVDIQASDRCHRISQTKPVVIYHLTVKNTIENRIFQITEKKRTLEKVVVKTTNYMRKNTDEKRIAILEELNSLIEHVDEFKEFDTLDLINSKSKLDELLDRTDLYKQMAKNV